MHDPTLSIVVIAGIVYAVDNVALELKVVRERGVGRIVADFEAEKPLAYACILVFLQLLNFFVELNQVLVLLNDRLKRVRIIIDAPVADQI